MPSFHSEVLRSQRIRLAFHLSYLQLHMALFHEELQSEKVHINYSV